MAQEKTKKDSASAAAKPSAVMLAVEEIEKQFGPGAIMRLGDEACTKNIAVIPTGAVTLDIALGVGGVPKGRVIEIFGPESSGKTTLALQIVANAQKAGGVGAFIDAEHALDPQYAKKLGVKLDELLISQPDCGEDALSIAEMLVKSDAVDVVVIDSVAALVPKAELEGEMSDSQVGLQARLMSKALRKLTASISRTSTCCIFINQIREKIGGMAFANNETTPGGRALKFYASVRVDVRRIASIKNARGVVTGSRTRAKIVKNKVAPPFTNAEFDIMYDEGISAEGAIIDLAIETAILERKGSWILWNGERLGQGRDAAIQELKKDSQLKEKLLSAVKLKAVPESKE